MKNYRITVNGVSYEVSVEELGTTNAPVSTPVSTPSAAPVAQKAAPAPVAAGSVAVKAPMPGTINRINVKVGDAVKKGDVLAVLEAMKMENDICAPQDGTVAGVNVAQGAGVAVDEVLVTLA